MTTPQFDVLVLGGGIHGVGVLQAAAAAGYSACLLEQRSLAAGTSSRSSKLIHGGLRYLENLQVALVRESLRERQILLRIAPGLVHWLPFTVPIYRRTLRRPLKVRAGLTLYSALAAGCEHSSWSVVARKDWEQLDGLKTEGLQAVYRYFDAQTDDAALVRAVARSAQALGARIECPCEFQQARRADQGWNVTAVLAGKSCNFHARTLVNAAGPWAALVQQKIHGAPESVPMELVQGAHIELDGALQHGAYYAEAPADRRAVFVLPWKGRTLVGTTEHAYQGDPAAVAPLAEEVRYLQDTFAGLFPSRSTAVLDAWAGLRVLPAGAKRAFSRPREAVFQTDHTQRPSLVSMYGGKLTGYRASALKVMELLRPSLGPGSRDLQTDEIPLEPEDR